MSKFYEVFYTPPVIDLPTGLTLDVTTPGEVGVTLVQPEVPTLRFTWVELTYEEDVWTAATILIVPFGYTYGTFTGVRAGSVWVRARGADVWGNFSEYSDIETAVATAASSSARWEVLMASGVTSPPDPVVSSDGTDWLYGEVPE